MTTFARPLWRLVVPTAATAMATFHVVGATGQFEAVPSIELALWDALLQVATCQLQQNPGRVFDVRDCRAGSRFGFVLGALDEALGLASREDRNSPLAANRRAVGAQSFAAGDVASHARSGAESLRLHHRRRCARALGDVAAVEAIVGVVDCRADGRDARGLVVALLCDA